MLPGHHNAHVASLGLFSTQSAAIGAVIRYVMRGADIMVLDCDVHLCIYKTLIQTRLKSRQRVESDGEAKAVGDGTFQSDGDNTDGVVKEDI